MSPAAPCSSSAHVLTSTGPRAGSLGRVETLCPVARAAGPPQQQEGGVGRRGLGEAPRCLQPRSCSRGTRSSRQPSTAVRAAGSEAGAESCRTGGGLDALALPWGDCPGSPARAQFRRGARDGAQDSRHGQRTRGTAGNRLDSWALSPKRMPHRTVGTHTTHATNAHITDRKHMYMSPLAGPWETLLPAVFPRRGLGDEAMPLDRSLQSPSTRLCVLDTRK